MPSTENLLFANYSNKLGKIIVGRNCSLLDNGLQRRHFGVEIEACDYESGDGYVDYDTAEDAVFCLFDPFDTKDGLYDIKDDCSLVGNHFEMVTSPMTMSLLKGLNWPDFFETLLANGYKQTDFNDYDKAGIHVHVNRKSLSHPFEAAVNALAFITENEDTIRRFARRARSNWDDWCTTPYELYNHLDRFKEEIANGDYSSFGWKYHSPVQVDETRYRAVNFCSDRTWELRIFNSTLDAQDMYNILDFSEALWSLADTDHYDMSLEAMHDRLIELGNPVAASQMYKPPIDTRVSDDYDYCDCDDDW